MDSKLRVAGYALACAGFSLAQFLALPYHNALQLEIAVGLVMLAAGLVTAMYGHSLIDRKVKSSRRDRLSTL